MNEKSDGGWIEYSKLVLMELERHNDLIEKMRDDISDIRGDVKLLNFKSGLWGALGGLVATASILLYHLIKQLL